MALLRSSSYVAAFISGFALVAAVIGFSTFAALMSELETELETVMIDYRSTSDHIWQDLITEELKIGPNIRRQVPDPRCLDGSEPLRTPHGAFIKCAEEPCPIGFRCTVSEIPFFRFCCPKNLGDARLQTRNSYGTNGYVEASCVCSRDANRCPSGVKGSRGPPGLDGLPGRTGEPGRPGLVGDDKEEEIECGGPCPQGPKGPQGQRGPSGIPGPRGRNGNGANGGRVGQPGLPGPDGSPGVAGSDGRPGYKGQPGTPGRAGGTGEKGRNGQPGEAGPPGPQGSPGQSAGPSEPGDPGPQGSPGFPGQDGNPGDPGSPGAAARPGNDANYCPCPDRGTGESPQLRSRLTRFQERRNRQRQRQQRQRQQRQRQ